MTLRWLLAQCRIRTMKTRNETRYIAVHCSASPPSQDIGCEEIRAGHLAKGWADIGYHVIIRRSGTVDIGRSMTAVGAHVRGYNSVSLGICLVGGVSEYGVAENNFTPNQWTTLATVLRFCRLAYPEAEIKGHRDFSPDVDGSGTIERDEWLKECPCFDVEGFVNGLGI